MTNVTHAPLATTDRAIHRATLAAHELSDAEHPASSPYFAIDELAERLDDYAACLAGEDTFPF